MSMSKSDQDFLGYVALHSKTERHAFSRADADRLMGLAGVEQMKVDDCGLPGFVGIDEWEAQRLIKLAVQKAVKT